MPVFQAVSAIESLPGMEEMKEFCSRLVQTAENLKGLRLEYVPLPNLVFAAMPGVGTTLHLRLLCDLLKELKLFRFQGEEEYFEWMLTDEKESLHRLIMRTNRASGFYGHFRGIIGLDISSMITDTKEAPLFTKMLEYVESQQPAPKHG